MSAVLQFPPLRIYYLGHPHLRTKCTAVDLETPGNREALREVFARMFAYCIGEFKGQVRALGLAAPQIGISERFFVFRTELDHDFRAVVNPVLLSSEGGQQAYLEGCESIPGFEATIFRSEKIHVEFIDGFTGEPTRLWLNGLEARVFQHELDHLNGELITDLCSKNDLRRGKRFIDRAEKAGEKQMRHENQPR